MKLYKIYPNVFTHCKELVKDKQVLIVGMVEDYEDTYIVQGIQSNNVEFVFDKTKDLKTCNDLSLYRIYTDHEINLSDFPKDISVLILKRLSNYTYLARGEDTKTIGILNINNDWYADNFKSNFDGLDVDDYILDYNNYLYELTQKSTLTRREKFLIKRGEIDYINPNYLDED